jgi:hypothetical protein
MRAAKNISRLFFWRFTGFTVRVLLFITRSLKISGFRSKCLSYAPTSASYAQNSSGPLNLCNLRSEQGFTSSTKPI